VISATKGRIFFFRRSVGQWFSFSSTTSEEELLGGGFNMFFYIIIAPIRVFPKIGVRQNGWFIMEHLIKMDDLGVTLFLETPEYGKRFPI